jgi:hypothetical protein
MTMTKWIAALAAVTLATAPAAAQAARTAAPVEDGESLTGGATIAWIVAAIMVIGAILIIIDDDDDGNDLPSSP